MKETPAGRRLRQNSFGFLIQLLARRVEVRLAKQLSAVDIDIKMLANLMLLRQKDGINQRELGHLLDFPEYATSRNVDALVKAGFVERQVDPNNRRAYKIYLTEAGREKSNALPAIIASNNQHFLEDFSASEKEQLIYLLQKAAGISEHNSPEIIDP